MTMLTYLGSTSGVQTHATTGSNHDDQVVFYRQGTANVPLLNHSAAIGVLTTQVHSP
jgi:hypothetical protein